MRHDDSASSRAFRFAGQTGDRRSTRIPPEKVRSARAAIACFGLAALAFHAAAMLLLDELRPGLRDPEYARRVHHYRARVAENPGRPMVMVVGSSRAAMGVCPAAWEDVRGEVAADALQHEPARRRAGDGVAGRAARFADGLRPAVVLFEYWPPYLYSDGIWTETQRIAIERLSPFDRPVVRDYFPDPDRAEARMRPHRWNPLWESRERILIQVFPKWFTNSRRIDWMWEDVDAWGWKPGFDYKPGPHARAGRDARGVSRHLPAAVRRLPHLAERGSRDPRSDRGRARAGRGGRLRLTCRNRASSGRGIRRRPSGSRANTSPRSVANSRCRSSTRASGWTTAYFVDGFHLSRIGAAEFTRKLGPAVAATFPEVQP